MNVGVANLKVDGQVYSKLCVVLGVTIENSNKQVYPLFSTTTDTFENQKMKKIFFIEKNVEKKPRFL